MKIVKLLERVVYNRKQILDIVYVKLRDGFKDLDTLTGLESTKLGIPVSLMPVSYESSANIYLIKVFRRLNITNNDSILDLGCGKAGTLILFSKFPFKKISGVEYSDELFNIASKNLKVLKNRRLQVFHDDAGCFTKIDEINYFYMFNPFGISTMNKVLINIEKSHERCPRRITIIYLNPILHEEIIKSNLFVKTKEFKSAFDYKFFVYVAGECYN